MPPARLFGDDVPAMFVPDRNYLRAFLDDQFLNEASPLYNVEHGHLQTAAIGFLWSTVPNSRRGKAVAGEAELTTRYASIPAGKWLKARIVQQAWEWFGDMPDFIITFDAAVWRDRLDDAGRLALFEHELYHCGQALDEFGFPRFNKKTGRPVFAVRGHDIEEFAGVVRRYGVAAAGSDRAEFVAAANAVPEITATAIRATCGVCA